MNYYYLFTKYNISLILSIASISLPVQAQKYMDDLHCDPILKNKDTRAKSNSIDCNERMDIGYVRGESFNISVVSIDGEPVERETANAYWVMQQAAQDDGVDIRISSGFRTYDEQLYFYNCYINCNCNQCNLAARPGYSNHQSGHALDLNTSRSEVFTWLNQNAATFGFSRTVPSEPWHWEWWGGGPGGGLCSGEPCTLIQLQESVLDNDGDCFIRYGPNEYWRYVEGEGVGGNLYWTNAHQSDEASNWAQWNLFFEQSGYYFVEVSTGATHGIFDQTQYRVRHAGELDTQVVDQSSSNEWQDLGIFYFDQSNGQSVAVFDHTNSTVADNQHITADAVRITPTACKLIDQAEVILDEQGPCFRAYGSMMYWRSVTGEGYNGHLLWTNAYQSDGPSNWAEWYLFFDQAGQYEIEVRTGGMLGIFQQTAYHVYHSNAESHIQIDQSLSDEWQSLGVFDFHEGTGQRVAVFDHTDIMVEENQHIMVDAIRVRKMGQQPTMDDMMLVDVMDMDTSTLEDMLINSDMNQESLDMFTHPHPTGADWTGPEIQVDMNVDQPSQTTSNTESMNQVRPPSHGDEGCSASHSTHNHAYYMLVLLLYAIGRYRRVLTHPK